MHDEAVITSAIDFTRYIDDVCWAIVSLDVRYMARVWCSAVTEYTVSAGAEPASQSPKKRLGSRSNAKVSRTLGSTFSAVKAPSEVRETMRLIITRINSLQTRSALTSDSENIAIIFGAVSYLVMAGLQACTTITAFSHRLPSMHGSCQSTLDGERSDYIPDITVECTTQAGAIYCRRDRGPTFCRLTLYSEGSLCRS